MVAFGSGPEGASLASGVPSSKQKFSDGSEYVRLQVGQRFISKLKRECLLGVRWLATALVNIKATSSLNKAVASHRTPRRCLFPARTDYKKSSDWLKR